MIREDADRKLFSAGVAEEIAQLQKLIAVDPPLPFEEIAHRMVTTQPKLRRVMQLMGIDHEGLHRPLQANRKQATATRRRKRRAAAARSNGNANGSG